ncbi:MAG: protein kinase domain-containing protein, partial [Acidobacteriota bacterium]
MGQKRGQLGSSPDVELMLGDTTLPSQAGAGETERSPARPSAADLDAGTQLGKYQLVRLLGVGGMGAVWEARDCELDRRVALKILRRDATDDADRRERLIREARAMARLRHANVITVFDAARLDGRDVIAMELVEGETLAGWLSRPHSRDERVAMLLAAGRGLAAAHGAGL